VSLCLASLYYGDLEDDRDGLDGMILHIPHASRAIPAEYRAQLLLTDAELAEELVRMTDAYTDDLFDMAGACRVVFPISRLVVDPERFPNDEEEPMAAVGIGAVYTRTSHGLPLRHELSPAERDELIGRFYCPHHEKLTEAVRAEMEQYGSALLIDCHSFPSRPLPCDAGQDPERPDFCVGTDPLHTPEWMVDIVCTELRGGGHTVAVNRPYSGVLVPTEYLKDERVTAVMVEVNRALYMHESSGQKAERYDETKTVIAGLLRVLAEEWSASVNLRPA